MQARALARIGTLINANQGDSPGVGHHLPMSLRFRGAVLLGAAIGACASPPVGQKDLLAFLESGAPSRAEVIQRLGTPHALYEGGRIVAYRIAEDEGGYYLPGLGRPAKYSVVLVFEPGDQLRRYSLVKVRSR